MTTTAKTATTPAMRRTDVLALWGGILFSLVFTGIIWLAGRWLAELPHLPDTGADMVLLAAGPNDKLGAGHSLGSFTC